MLAITSVSTSAPLGDQRHRNPSSTTHKTHKDLLLRSSGARPPQRAIANASELTLTTDGASWRASR